MLYTCVRVNRVSQFKYRLVYTQFIKKMQLSSSAFGNQASIPSKYTCDGANISPPLRIESLPENTKSLAIIAHDPDAPGGDFIHWVVWNIEPNVKEIPENSIASPSVEGVTSFGSVGYGGPCPPSGNHRYVFTLYALDRMLDLDTADKTQLKTAMDGHILETAQLIGLYERKK